MLKSPKKKRKKKSGTVLPYRQTESIEMIIEDQAFSPSPDMAPSPPLSPPPLPSVRTTGDTKAD
jgi:hypothetical protein